MAGGIKGPDGRIFEIKDLTKEQWREVFAPYGAELGHIAFSWNRLHDSLSEIFAQIFAATSIKIASEVWYSIDNDFAQRKMLRAASKLLDEAKQKSIAWMLNEIDASLRHRRNSAIHAPLMFIAGMQMVRGVGTMPHYGVMQNFLSSSPHVSNLGTENLIAEFAYCSAFAEALAEYAASIVAHLKSPGSLPWPGKPSMPRDP